MQGLGLLGWLALAGTAPGVETNYLTGRPWFETRSAHFEAYGCGSTQAVARVVARLEQFQEAYSILAGAQAVASPPIVVMALPDHATLNPLLPLYEGKPANLAGFFLRGSDQNLIVLSLENEGNSSLQTIYHEYTHLLLRHNQAFWPLWLKEGMAEVYSTFEVVGHKAVRIGHPIESHLYRISHTPLMSLEELFHVESQSEEYNRGERQSLFYAQSWLLTHYLMLGPYPGYRSRLGYLTTLLKQGQPISQAFTNAFQNSLENMEQQLRTYFAAGQFTTLEMKVGTDLSAPRNLATRPLLPVEIPFRLGMELLRIDRQPAAEKYFNQALALAPASPLPYEGLGLLAVRRDQREAALNNLRQAIERNTTSYLVYSTCASELFEQQAASPGTYTTMPKKVAAEIRSNLEKALALMPDYGAAHHLLGFLLLVQAEDFAVAEQHLTRAIQLEPDNLSYLLSLAQVQYALKNPEAGRRTLQSLDLSYVPPKLRGTARELLQTLK
jgi:tetratricopeptide (TPR) repeat protein